MTTVSNPVAQRHFPISAGVFFGLGLGGFFDGIVLHQVLQWSSHVEQLVSRKLLRESRTEHALGRHLSQHDVCLRRNRTLHSVAIGTSSAPLLVHKAFARIDADRLRRVQCGGRTGRSSAPWHSPCQRDGAARPVAHMGHRISHLGRRDATRRLAAGASWTQEAKLMLNEAVQRIRAAPAGVVYFLFALALVRNSLQVGSWT